MTGTATVAGVGLRNERAALKTISTGAGKRAIVDVTFSSAYATGGDNCDFGATVGAINSTPVGAVCIAGGGGYVFSYDATNKKMLVYRQSAATSALTEANGVDLHTLTARFLVFY